MTPMEHQQAHAVAQAVSSAPKTIQGTKTRLAPTATEKETEVQRRLRRGGDADCDPESGDRRRKAWRCPGCRTAPPKVPGGNVTAPARGSSSGLCPHPSERQAQ